MTYRREAIRNGVLAIVLVMALVPWNPGAVFSASGEQLTPGLPLPTLVLLAGLFVVIAVSSARPLPWLPRPILIGTVALACGLLGGNWNTLPETAKELVQLGEITLVSVYFVQFGTRRQIRASLVWTMAGLELLLLVLAAVGGLGWLGLSPAKWGAYTTVAAPFAVLVMGRLGYPWLAVIPGALAGLGFPHAGPLLVWCIVVAVGSFVFGRRHRLALLAIPFALGTSLLPGQRGSWDRLRPHYDETHLKRSVIEAELALRSPLRLPLGAGLGEYKTAINHLRDFGAPDPHPADSKVPRDGNCQYLVTLVESGPIGLIGLLWLLVGACLAAWRGSPGELPQEAQDRRAVAVALIAALGAGVFSLTLARGIGVWLGILIGLAFDPHGQPLSYRRPWRVLGGWMMVVCILVVSLVVNGIDRAWPSRANRIVAGIHQPRRATRGPRIVVLPDTYGGGPTNVVTVEAETAFEVMAPFQVVKADGASGDKALAIPEGRGKGIGRATLRLSVPAAGRYLFFARVQWSDGCGNSIAFRIAGQEIRLADEVYERWHQVTGVIPLDLPAGDVQVQAVNLEDGIMLDYIGLQAAEEGAE